MKKLLTVVCALVLCLTLTACFAEDGSSAAGLANPMVEYASLEEINEKTGVTLLRPEGQEISNELFFVINDTIAQYSCEIDGKEWTFRGAYITDEDISGIYNEGNRFTPEQDFTLYDNEVYLERFFDGARQYTVTVTDPASADGDIFIGEEEFMNICMALESIQKQHMDDPLVGDYDDAVSQRAMATVERFGDVYNVYVSWSDSDSEYTCVTVYGAVLDGEQLTYFGEEHGYYVFDEDGNEISSDITATNNVGFFEIRDGQLYWTGAAQEEYRECVFEKAVY